MSDAAYISFRNGRKITGWKAMAILLFVWSLPFWLGLSLGLSVGGGL